MENYSLLMGAAAVMKMAVEMAAVSMEKPSGGTSPRRRAGAETPVPGSWLRDGGGSGTFSYRGLFVSGYSNNSYRGYETLEKAQQEYLTFLEEELLEDQAIDEAVPLAQLAPEEVYALQGAPPEVRPSRVKDYIISSSSW
ncbi:hypothetical protein QYE76_037236 [Lolium multiflorum]|uniref:Uncharacterized protein n=1 Tax=Lolium multiflorum TaxID=4521 RepID=A0AAD8QI09_LOLMU|nr:hypothetical protein QYE76_037236 [Lolium multiflorum]